MKKLVRWATAPAWATLMGLGTLLGMLAEGIWYLGAILHDSTL